MDLIKRIKPHRSMNTQEEKDKQAKQKNEILLQNPEHEEKGFDGQFI